MQTFLITKKELSETIYLHELCDNTVLIDNIRLNKQILEAFSILKILTKGSGHYFNHPAVQMWLGSEHLLSKYGLACCKNLTSKTLSKAVHKYEPFFEEYCMETRHNLSFPFWLENQDFLHEMVKSHHSNLINKRPEYYSFLKAPENLLYVWPNYYVFDKTHGFKITVEGVKGLLKTCKRKAKAQNVCQSEILENYRFYDGNSWASALCLLRNI